MRFSSRYAQKRLQQGLAEMTLLHWRMWRELEERLNGAEAAKKAARGAADDIASWRRCRFLLFSRSPVTVNLYQGIVAFISNAR
jgi:hypothetical protein